MKLVSNFSLVCTRFSTRGYLFPNHLSKVNIKFFSQKAADENPTGIHVGSKFSITRRFTPEDVKTFALLSGDHNPIHLDEAFASKTKFNKPIVHGMLANSLFSGLMAQHLGSGSLLLSMECAYLKPVFVNEEITAEVEVEKMEGLKVLLRLRCISNDSKKVLMEGSARGLVSKQSGKRALPSEPNKVQT